ncbi:putative RNA 3'-terminal phosphate cyclase [Aspergillus mulundensis]|uniref:RNA 3'-terminal phosphate cyclase domain-containing protein n=1 Tax=Aspergillus mulundensis TaxID=1810919 RepID=A0A3D8RK22_9EURO|nr:hypothetical protein DSM5745_06958 [Aspergillus mulundensis]RDW74296.1 hypothetical protein DSM5745_06958 [Aspergillus mulundensis]
MNQAHPPNPVRLDGRKLEGGGQLVRIAVALSALTGQAVTIDNIRGNRTGKRGLKASHLAAIQTLAELSGSTLVKAQVGSCSIGFYPPREREEARQINSEINIRLPTPGSVFLVFQALYPYLLRSTPTEQIRLSITGGTNVSSSPSYDYVAQVLIPNFARIGLPPLSVRLEKRGWASGQGHLGLGSVVFAVDTLWRRDANGGAPGHEIPFPSVDLRCRRGKISRIDITVLAPDDQLDTDAAGAGALGTKVSGSSRRRVRQDAAAQLGGSEKPESVREFMERYAHRALHKRLKELPRDIFLQHSSEGSSLQDEHHGIPIETHTTEATHHRSCMHVLMVAHTSTGFKLGREALYGSLGEKPRAKKGQNRPRVDMRDRVKGLVDECVGSFIRELYDPLLQAQSDTPETARHQPCVDEHMRDQLVIFEALARTSGDKAQECDGREDERYWSLHTKTAQWVCREMLGSGE